MPREFIPIRRRREPKSEALERPERDRMLRRPRYRRVAQCHPFREECWPERVYSQKAD